MVKTSLSHTIHWSVGTCRSLQVKLKPSFKLVDMFSNEANAKSCAFERKYTDGADILHKFLAL